LNETKFNQRHPGLENKGLERVNDEYMITIGKTYYFDDIDKTQVDKKVLKKEIDMLIDDSCDEGVDMLKELKRRLKIK
jgi:hypothetical protein